MFLTNREKIILDDMPQETQAFMSILLDYIEDLQKRIAILEYDHVEESYKKVNNMLLKHFRKELIERERKTEEEADIIIDEIRKQYNMLNKF